MQVNGTFTDTGQSDVITGRVIAIKMDFVGTASVDVEQLMPSGSWIKVETGIEADYSKVFDGGAMSTLRLNCTAHTDNAEYSMAVAG